MADNLADLSPAGRTPRAPIRRLGAWKLAYADFLTALCALFLVMWLVSGASASDRDTIAKQFGAADLAQQPQAEQPALTMTERALMQSALFSAESANIALTRHADSLRIELIDLDRAPLFETGDDGLNERGERLIRLAASVIMDLDLAVSIEGHTDSRPIAREDYSNWELSADRANAARRSLVSGGVPATLIKGVTGLADTQPLRSDAPHLPQNRRLSIVVHLDERP